MTEVDPRTKDLQKDPWEEGTANLRPQGPVSVSQAKERGTACAKAQQGESIWLWEIWKNFNSTSVEYKQWKDKATKVSGANHGPLMF